MQIEFVNHASFVVQEGNIRLLIDPWLEGYAFYEGWAHVSRTKFTYEDFKDITHIWFSHEHPDHFSPPVLSKIPMQYRKRITVLYQETLDKKVVELCKKMGFGNVVELKPEWVALSDAISVYNKPHSDGDSWICIRTQDCTLLNLNDCVMENDRQVEHIKQIAGKTDVLFTQFSYANWAGNKDDHATRKRIAEEKLQEILRQNRIVQPEYIVPFASFIWFCHRENFYLNDGAKKIDFIFDFIKQHTKATPVVMYPGDVWKAGSKGYNSIPAIERYIADWNAIMANPPLAETKIVAEDELTLNAKKFADDLLKFNSFFIQLLKPTRIYITDYAASYIFSLKTGLQKSEMAADNCDIALSADALNYCFKYLWGGGTLRVNGRYQLPPRGSFFNFKIYFQISQMNNFGERFNLVYIAKQVWKRISRKLSGA
ncbi:MAG: MBL fold metallo-hydrolase [Chitinophagales bacterium]|nr:MBL fold metallo-hydrolase [Chitinophagales bacterium]